MSWLIVVLLKPFFTLAFFTIVFAIAASIARWMPENKLKRALFSEIH